MINFKPYLLKLEGFIMNTFRYNLWIFRALFSLMGLSLVCMHISVSTASPLGPDPELSFEGLIDYQANADTLLRCDLPVCVPPYSGQNIATIFRPKARQNILKL